MTTIVTDFMKEHFKNLILLPPLFYSWDFGIRFEIANPDIREHEDKRNLQQIAERSTSIFNQVFQEEDEILLVTDIQCEKNDSFLQERPVNIYRKYLKNKNALMRLQHLILPSVWDVDDEDYEDMVTHRFHLLCQKKDLRYRQLLSAISYEDFAHPTTILKHNNRAGYEIYFVNVTRKLIYHLYDDRGCDVIASNKEDLRPLYVACNDWILDYDREQIDVIFK